MPLRALYLLAAPATPEPVAEQIAQQVTTGSVAPTHAAVNEAVAKAPSYDDALLHLRAAPAPPRRRDGDRPSRRSPSPGPATTSSSAETEPAGRCARVSCRPARPRRLAPVGSTFMPFHTMILARACARLYNANATEVAPVGVLRNGLVQREGGAMAAVTATGKPGVAKAPAIKSRAYIHVPHDLGERVADVVASGMGSWTFIIGQSIIVGLWIILNLLAFLGHWDPYPFILLNLLFSTQAAYAAPIIMMSQNRQAAKDRLRDDHEAEEVDLLYQINQNQLEILTLLRGQLCPPGTAGGARPAAPVARKDPAPARRRR